MDLNVCVRCPILPEDVPSTWPGPETKQLPVSHLIPQQCQTHRYTTNTTWRKITHTPFTLYLVLRNVPTLFIFFVSGSIFTLGESGRSESRTMLRSPKEERPDITQLRKVTHDTRAFFTFYSLKCVGPVFFFSTCPQMLLCCTKIISQSFKFLLNKITSCTLWKYHTFILSVSPPLLTI